MRGNLTKSIFSLFIILQILCSVSIAREDIENYGTYVLFPQGSVRVMAIGGAAVAISEDAAAMLYNPAGTAFADWRFDAGSTNNKVNNEELAYNFPKTYGVYETQYDSPYSYNFYAAAVRMGDWVVGLGYSSPFYYEFSDVNPISNMEVARLEIKVTSFDMMLTRRFGEFVALGVTGHSERVDEYYRNSTLTGSSAIDGIRTSGTGQYFSSGMMFRNKIAGMGFSYYPKRKMQVDLSKDDDLAAFNTVVFRDVYIPAKTNLGAFYQWSRLLVAFDVDMVEKADNTIYVSSVSTSSELVNPKAYQVLHGGVEITVYKSKNLAFYLRGGGYTEPSRFENGRSRDHITFGAELGLGPLVLSYAADQAPKFSNSAYGVSFNILAM